MVRISHVTKYPNFYIFTSILDSFEDLVVDNMSHDRLLYSEIASDELSLLQGSKEETCPTDQGPASLRVTDQTDAGTVRQDDDAEVWSHR